MRVGECFRPMRGNTKQASAEGVSVDLSMIVER